MIFPLEKFRLTFPLLNSVPNETVLAQSELALCFASARGCTCSEMMWMLLTAHLLQLMANASTGAANGIQTSATVGKVSVSFAAPPATTGWGFWLNLSPYGAQFMMLYQSCSVASYVGGRAERSGFRIVGGRFPHGRR